MTETVLDPTVTIMVHLPKWPGVDLYRGGVRCAPVWSLKSSVKIRSGLNPTSMVDGYEFGELNGFFEIIIK